MHIKWINLSNALKIKSCHSGFQFVLDLFSCKFLPKCLAVAAHKKCQNVLSLIIINEGVNEKWLECQRIMKILYSRGSLDAHRLCLALHAKIKIMTKSLFEWKLALIIVREIWLYWNPRVYWNDSEHNTQLDIQLQNLITVESHPFSDVSLMHKFEYFFARILRFQKSFYDTDRVSLTATPNLSHFNGEKFQKLKNRRHYAEHPKIWKLFALIRKNAMTMMKNRSSGRSNNLKL